jgi:hypothetical protein
VVEVLVKTCTNTVQIVFDKRLRIITSCEPEHHIRMVDADYEYVEVVEVQFRIPQRVRHGHDAALSGFRM